MLQCKGLIEAHISKIPYYMTRSFIFLLALLPFLPVRPLHAEENKILRTYQPQISAILQRVSGRILNGEKYEGARLHLARAMAKNGNYPGAQSLIRVIQDPARRASAWGYLGRAQGKLGGDRVAATASFNSAAKDARLITSGGYDINFSLRSIVVEQAQSGDIKGALLLGDEIDAIYKMDGLKSLARVAAREGRPQLAEKLLRNARNEDEVAEANF